MRSLVATTSMSDPDASMARKKLRPMRPKPLIPTRTVTMPGPSHDGDGMPRGAAELLLVEPIERGARESRRSVVRAGNVVVGSGRVEGAGTGSGVATEEVARVDLVGHLVELGD